MDIDKFIKNLYFNRQSNLYKYDNTMIYGYIYLVYLPDERYYIGQKKYIPENSINYYGSGKHINNIINKLTGFNSNKLPYKIAEDYCIKKYIIDYAIDQSELDFLERLYISNGKDLETFENQCLNMHPGGQSSYYNPPGKFKLTPESIEKAKQTKKRKRELGLYTITNETKQKMSEGIKKARKIKPVWNKGLTKDSDNRIKNLIDNRDQSYRSNIEYKEKISKVSKNTTWYNNGKKSIRLHEDDEIPEGFVKGMVKKKRNEKVILRG